MPAHIPMLATVTESKAGGVPARDCECIVNCRANSLEFDEARFYPAIVWNFLFQAWVLATQADTAIGDSVSCRHSERSGSQSRGEGRVFPNATCA